MSEKEKEKEHSHQWVFYKETIDYIVFKCTVRGCHVMKWIDKHTGKETIA